MFTMRGLAALAVIGKLLGIEALARACRSGTWPPLGSAARRLPGGFGAGGFHGAKPFDWVDS